MTTKEKSSSINWIRILLALLIITAVRFVWSKIIIDTDEVKDSRQTLGLVSPEEMESMVLSSKSINVDLREDGQIIIDGKSAPLEELERLALVWKSERRMISYYRHPNAGEENSMTDRITKVLIDSGLTLSPRKIPQIGEQAAPSNR